MPKTAVEEIKNRISRDAFLFSNLQESIQLEILKNNKDLTDFLRNNNQFFSTSQLDKLTSNLSTISDILNKNLDHYEITYKHPKTNKEFSITVSDPFTKDSLVNGLKRCYEEKISKDYSYKNQNNKRIELHDPNSEILNQPFFANVLREIDSIKKLPKDGEAFKSGDIKIKRCSTKEFKKETLKELYDCYVEASSSVDYISKAFKEANSLLKDESLSQEVIDEKKNKKEKIPLIESFVNTVEPIIKESMNAFSAVKMDDCKSIEEAFMFSGVEHFSLENVNVQKFGGNQSLRTKMSYSFSEPGQGVPEKFSKIHEGFFSERNKYDYEGLVKENRAKLEGRFKEQYDNFYSIIYNQHDRFDASHDADWVKAHPIDKNKKYSNAEKEKYERDRLNNKLSHYGGDASNLLISRFASTVKELDGKYYIPDNVEPDIGDRNSKNSIFSGIKEGPERDAAWKYFQNNRKNPEFIASLIEFKNNYDSLRVVQSISSGALGFEQGTEVSYKNCAMTAIAKALDMDVIADSYKMNIVDNGKTIEGVFMEKANGIDLINLENSEQREKIIKNGFDDPRFLKSISDLQILDYICGNVDRHGGNLCYKLDEKGEKVIGVVGFDNDSSFGSTRKDKNSELHLLMSIRNIKAIDEKTANAVMNMKEDTLRGILSPYNLTETEILASIDRLQQVKSAILVNSKTKNNQPSYKIPILSDKDWKKHKFDDFLPDPTHTNTFSEINKTLDKLNNGKYYAINDPKKLASKAFTMTSSLNSLDNDLAKYEKELKSAKSIFKNSKEYNDLVKLVSGLKDGDNHIDSFGFTKDIKGLDKTRNQMTNYMQTVNAIKMKAENYLEIKKEDIEKGNIDSKTKKKIEIVNNLINNLNQKETIINNDFEKYQRECKENIDVHAMQIKEKNVVGRQNIDVSKDLPNEMEQNKVIYNDNSLVGQLKNEKENDLEKNPKYLD